MPKTLISLISEQTITNVQLIKEFEHGVDEFYSLLMKKMEDNRANRTDWIVAVILLQNEKSRPIITNYENEYLPLGFVKLSNTQ